jgi:hypothetical protein
MITTEKSIRFRMGEPSHDEEGRSSKSVSNGPDVLAAMIPAG